MKKLILSIGIICNLGTLMAQDTLRTDAFDVIKDYKPTLTDIIKIASNPNPEIPDIKPPKLSYTLPAVKLNAAPTLYTIKPLSLGTALLPKLKSNYVKIGYGNYNMPLLQASYTSTRNKKMQAGVWVNHLSASPSNNAYRSFSDNGVNLWGKKFVNKGVISADLAYQRDVVHYYGFDDAIAKPAKADVKKLYQTWLMGAGYSNVTKDTASLRYDVGIAFKSFSDNESASENNLQFNSKFIKRINGNPLEVTFAINNLAYKKNEIDFNRLLINFNPYYTLNFSQRAYVKFGFNTTFYTDSIGTKFFPFVVAEAAYQILPKAVTLFGGITGNYQANSYASIANENQFISTYQLRNTHQKFKYYVGVKGEISAQTSFNLQYAGSTVQNMLFYGYDSSTFGQTTVYDTTTSTVGEFIAELNHEFSDKFHLNFVMNYYNYSLALSNPFSRPTFTTRTSLMYNIGKKFMVRAQMLTMNNRTAIEMPSNQTYKLSKFTDIGFGVDYRYNKQIGLFLNVNNITNNQYQYWLNYPVFGFSVLGGLTVTF